MEGSSEIVKMPHCGGGQRCRPLAILLRKAFVVSVVLVPLAFSQSFDFLVIKNTNHLVIYDSFQQSLASSQGPAIRPFAPMKILAVRDLLGDGLTRCMKVDVDGEVFYLVRDDSGKLAGWKDLGYVTTFQGRKYIGDTISVLASNRITLQKTEKDEGIMLAAGDRCIRYFDQGGSVYVKKLGIQPAYGWISLMRFDRGRLWQMVRPVPVQMDLSQMLRDRVIGRIKEINEMFMEVYGLLGKETGKKFPVPQWSVDSSTAVLSCVLMPATAVRFYPRTLTELSAALQAYVVGTGYDVHAVENRIEIRKR